MFAGVTSSSRATCANTEMRRRDRRWNSDSGVRSVISDSVVPSDSKQLSHAVAMAQANELSDSTDAGEPIN